MIKKYERIIGILLIALLIFPTNLFPTIFNVKAEGANSIYHQTFDSDDELPTQSGNARIERITDADFNETGNALSLTRRSNDFDAVDLIFYDIGIEEGYSYEVTVTGFVDEDTDVPAGSDAVLSLVDSYAWISNVMMEAGEQFTLKSAFTADFSTDDRLRIQSNENGATVPFYISEILIEEVAAPSVNSEEVEPEERDPALPFEVITFEDGDLNGFESRGDAETITVTDEANHTGGGSHALKVEDREEDWNGPSLRVESFIDQGDEYHISAWVKLIEPSNAEITLSSQVGSGDYGASYNNIQSATISANDDWVELSGSYRYSSVADDYVTIYVESANPEASFYIDDINFKKIESEAIELEEGMGALKDIYEDYFLIGNAVSTSEFQGDRLDLLSQHYNLVTAEMR